MDAHCIGTSISGGDQALIIVVFIICATVILKAWFNRKGY